jgi:hypothetical protein
MTDLHYILIFVSFIMIVAVACMVKVAKAYDEAFDPESADTINAENYQTTSIAGVPGWNPTFPIHPNDVALLNDEPIEFHHSRDDAMLCNSKGLKGGK